MAAAKTKPTNASIDAYLAERASPEQLADCRAIMAMCRRVTREPPRMWGPSIVGYGKYAYTYPSGHTGESCLVGFAVRGKELVIYVVADTPDQAKLLATLGKHKRSKACLYFKRLADLDVKVLEQLITGSVNEVRRRYPSADEQAPKGRANSKKNTPGLNPETANYNATLSQSDRAICDLLAQQINANLAGAENKIWHAHPVWFLEGNPIVGYSKLKQCVRLLFWSGQSFDEPGLQPEGTFQAAEARYTAVDQVNVRDLKRWLRKARDIQWDYKNIVRRKGKLERLK